MTRASMTRVAAAGLVAMTWALAGSLPEAGADEAPPPARHVWLDATGKPLPFQANAEIEEFLRGARVVSRKEIGVGINKMDRLLMEKDGVQAHAIFRTIEEKHERLRVGDRLYMRFIDSWAGECAAYAVDQLYGIDKVPPTVKRHLDGQQGSMQIWIENARDHTAKDFSPPSTLAWVQQTWGMFVLDSLIFNADRNTGNMLAGEDYKLWLIDHTRAFQPVGELFSPDKVERLRRRAWKRLLEVSGEDLADATREYLDPDQVAALKARRELLVRHIQALIEERGEDVALF